LPTKKISSEKLFKKILPQLELLRKIGGLTLSGGEPLLQHKQIKDLLIRCKNDNIHTTIETSASVPFSFFENIYNEVDSWLFGIRPISNKYQGKLPDFNLVIDNLRKLSNLNNNNITIRTPIIQNVIDTQYQINQIIDIMRKNKLSRIELLPYNPYTNHYYSATGRKFKNNFYSVNNETMNIFQNQFNKRNINVKIMNIN